MPFLSGSSDLLSRPWETRSVFVLHATKKVLDRCGGPSASTASTTTVLGDWYVTALFWRPQVALFVNEQTRLPVFVPFAPVAGLVPRFVGYFEQVLVGCGIDPRFTNAERVEMSEHRYAKTVNRSVVGTMTEFSFLADVHRDRFGADDLLALSLRLAGTPCGPLRGGHRFPDQALQAMVGQVPGIY